MLSSLALLSLFSLASAQAGSIELWSMDDFGPNGVLVGNKDGWKGGYTGDAWAAYQSAAYTMSDDNVGGANFEAYGDNTAADNWVVRGEAYAQGKVEAKLFNEDDDAMGVVSHLSADDRFYIAVIASNSAPPPVNTTGSSSLIVIKVDEDGGEVLINTAAKISGNGQFSLTFEVNDGEIIASVDGKEVARVTDPNPLPAGQVGLYAYDAGRTGGDNTDAGATAITASLSDDDDDGVADDADNCETVKNADQADKDKDGLGDACDEPVDTGTPDDTGATDDTGTSGDDTSSTGDDTGTTGDDSGGLVRPDQVVLRPGCACSSAEAPSAWWGLVLGALALLRRRAR